MKKKKKKNKKTHYICQLEASDADILDRIADVVRHLRRGGKSAFRRDALRALLDLWDEHHHDA